MLVMVPIAVGFNPCACVIVSPTVNVVTCPVPSELEEMTSSNSRWNESALLLVVFSYSFDSLLQSHPHHGEVKVKRLDVCQ